MLKFLHRYKSDEALMLAYQAGNSGAFELLYQRHKDGLFAFIYRSCAQTSTVEDICQDTWIAVVNAAERYQPRASFKTWLYQIAHHRLIDFWRSKDRQHSALENVPEPACEDVTHERREQLMAAVGLLPQEQKNTLLLQQQGFTLDEIAHITDTATETVKSRLRYARQHLQNTLQQQPREQLGDNDER